MYRPGQPTQQVRFGEFQLDLQTAELQNNDHKVMLQDQPFQVLTILLEQPGRLVTRTELKNRLWPSDTFVDFDHGLNKAVNRLREALGDSAESPTFIETLPRKGYRFISPVSVPTHSAVAQSPLPSVVKNWNRGIVVLILFAAGTIGYGIHKWKSDVSRRSSFDIQTITKITSSGRAEDVAILLTAATSSTHNATGMVLGYGSIRSQPVVRIRFCRRKTLTFEG